MFYETLGKMGSSHARLVHGLDAQGTLQVFTAAVSEVRLVVISVRREVKHWSIAAVERQVDTVVCLRSIHLRCIIAKVCYLPSPTHFPITFVLGLRASSHDTEGIGLNPKAISACDVSIPTCQLQTPSSKCTPATLAFQLKGQAAEKSHIPMQHSQVSYYLHKRPQILVWTSCSPSGLHNVETSSENMYHAPPGSYDQDNKPCPSESLIFYRLCLSLCPHAMPKSVL